jgi:CHAD domain-containing protein
MNGQLSEQMLAEPAKRAARVIARARLDVVRDAYARFGSDDADALHDLRVGLRRLRSWLRAFRPELDDTVRGKTRRRLRDLTHATNAARDIEVWSAWIATKSGLSARARPGLRYVTRWLHADAESQQRKATKRIRSRLPALLDSLERELSTYTAPVPSDDGATNETTMADAMAELIQNHHRRFARRLDRVDSANDIGAIHRCRIAAKRLRYLLEALDEFVLAKEATASLVEMQDALGDVRDLRLFLHRMVDRIGVVAMLEARRRAAKTMAVAANDAPSPALSRVRPGMLALAKAARKEADGAFETFRAAWDETRLASLSRNIETLTGELRKS